MANQQAYLGQSGAVYYDDSKTGWYPAPNNTLPMGGALCPSMYVTDDPIYDLNVPNKKYVDKVVLFELNADSDIQPKKRYAANSTAYYNIVPTTQVSGLLTVGRTYKILDWITDDDFVNVGGANVDGTVFVATGTTPTHWAHSSKLVGYQDLGSAVLPWDKIYVTNIYAAGVNISGLTVSLPVITDGSKNLVSIAYTGATSFRKNLGLETSDSPTFAGLGATPIITSLGVGHSIGGSPSAQVSFWLKGTFVSTSDAYGLFLTFDMTPGGTNGSGYGLVGSLNFRMVTNQTHPLFATLMFNPGSIIPAAGASVTEATTVRITGAPTAGVSNYAVHVVAGASKFGALTASLPVITNADKVLASLPYTGATSFRKNLGLETDDSPTFNQGNFTTLHTTTILADHVGEHTGAHTVVFDNTVTLPASTIISDAGTIGLGSGKGLIQFDDETTDFISFLNCKVGIGVATPIQTLDVVGSIKASTNLTIGDGTASASFYFNADSATNLGSLIEFQKDGVGTCDIGHQSVLLGGTSNNLVVFLGTADIRVYMGSGGDVFYITNAGKVGINDISPAEVLDVNGNINATGVLKIDDVQVVSNRVVDATIDNSIEAAFTALYPLASALLAGIQTAIKSHGLMAAA